MGRFPVGRVCTSRVTLTAAIRIVRAVRLGGSRVPRRFDDLVRRVLTLLVFLQRHDELSNLNDHTDQGQADALEREYVPDDRHQGAHHHFDVTESHVHGLVLVLVAAAAAAAATAALFGSGGEYFSRLVDDQIFGHDDIASHLIYCGRCFGPRPDASTVGNSVTRTYCYRQ